MQSHFARLSSDEPEDRIDALRDLTSSVPDIEWPFLGDYLRGLLETPGEIEPEELALALDLAVQAPFPEVHDIVFEFASDPDDLERSRAIMSLARVGDDVAPLIVRLLASPTFEGPREILAEHLLLVDVSSVVDDLDTLWRTEEVPEVRFWIAGALSEQGDSSALAKELIGNEIPDELRSLVRMEEPSTEVEGRGGNVDQPQKYRVEPRLQRLERAEQARGAGTRLREILSELPDIVDESFRHGKGSGVEVRGGGPEEAIGEGGPGGRMPPEGAAGDTSDGQPAVSKARYFEGLAPNRVKLGETVGIQIRMALETTPGAVATSVVLEVPSGGMTLSVTTHLPGFELAGGQQFQELPVPHEGDSEWLLYRVRAMREGVHDLSFTAFHPEGRMLAELVIQISVDAILETTSTREVRANALPLEGETGEVSLLVEWQEETAKYSFRLVDRSHPEAVLTERLQRTPQAIVEALIGELEVLAKNTPIGGQSVRARLRDRGVQLWSELIPQQLQQQFWERQDKITSLRILAQDDPIPWELLYPLSPGNDAGFLVEQFPVLRSIRGVPPVGHVGRGSVETVLPGVGAPSSAQAEIDAVRAQWASREGGPTASNLDALRRILEEAKFGVLHMACHNVFDPNDADRTAIQFPDQPFTPVVLAPMRATKAFSASSPLIFLNACRSGGEAPLYTNLSGWASSFLDAGAGAFVGSLWSVRDKSSKTFAEVFYSSFAGGENLGSSLMKARQAIVAEADPTWLAYTAYGDPRAVI